MTAHTQARRAALRSSIPHWGWRRLRAICVAAIVLLLGVPVAGAQQASLTVRNTTAQPVDIVWLDDSGAEEAIGAGRGGSDRHPRRGRRLDIPRGAGRRAHRRAHGRRYRRRELGGGRKSLRPDHGGHGTAGDEPGRHQQPGLLPAPIDPDRARRTRGRSGPAGAGDHERAAHARRHGARLQARRRDRRDLHHDRGAGRAVPTTGATGSAGARRADDLRRQQPHRGASRAVLAPRRRGRGRHGRAGAALRHSPADRGRASLRLPSRRRAGRVACRDRRRQRPLRGAGTAAAAAGPADHADRRQPHGRHGRAVLAPR